MEYESVLHNFVDTTHSKEVKVTTFYNIDKEVYWTDTLPVNISWINFNSLLPKTVSGIDESSLHFLGAMIGLILANE